MADKPEIKHWPGCSPKYLKKPKEEPPQPIMKIDISDSEVILQCGKCGAFVIVKKEGASE